MMPDELQHFAMQGYAMMPGYAGMSYDAYHAGMTPGYVEHCGYAGMSYDAWDDKL